jgi:hypothetical protein
MVRRIAVKRLTESDLTIFTAYYRRPDVHSKQKAVNLNAEVFVDEFFPQLQQTRRQKFQVALYVYGPGNHGELEEPRLVVKQQKNWRLDGKLIDNPEDARNRFDQLRPDDVVVMEFIGGPDGPEEVRAVFLARANALDGALAEECSAFLGTGRSMASCAEADLRAMVSRALVSDDHPVHQILLEADLEDAALGGAGGQAGLRRRGSRRNRSPEALQQAKIAAEETGHRGELLVDRYLDAAVAAGEIRASTWVAATDATAPYDFEIETSQGVRRIDVKSTAYDFASPLHVSFAELECMARSAEPYDIYRVYAMTETKGELRIAAAVGAFAGSILSALSALPQGVTVDSVSVRPGLLRFGPPVALDVDGRHTGAGYGAHEHSVADYRPSSP